MTIVEFEEKPEIGILMLDTRFPRIPGDVGNPETFSFPVLYKVVRGASSKRVVKEADPCLISDFIAAGQELEEKGVKAIATSCGFLAIFHRELRDAFSMPVYTSSLLQVHFLQSIIRKDQKIGILTARQASLSDQHFRAVGIDHYPTVVAGMDDAEEFTSVFIGGKETLDREKCEEEVVAAALGLVRDNPETGAIVLECTNMPPYADAIRKITGLPVFDVVTMLNAVHDSVSDSCFSHPA